MKKILLTFILVYNFQFIANAEDKIETLFGIKLNSDISLHANVEDGKISPSISTSEVIYTFANKFLKNINKDPSFDNYNIRTNDNFKIKVVNAGKLFKFDNKKFTNKDCNNEKEKYLRILLDELNLDELKFKTFYRKNNDKKRKFDFLWYDTSYVYKDGSEEFRLMVICNHRTFKNKIVSNLFVSWMTEDYYRKNVMLRFKIIEPFDNKFIENYLFSKQL